MLGIDISEQSVKIAQIGLGGGRRLTTHCWHGVPEGTVQKGEITNQVAMQQVLHEALEKCKLPSRKNITVVASVPETESFLRVIEIPIMEPAEISEAVQWEVAQHIPFGIDNVYVDWQPVRRHKRTTTDRQEVLVGAAEKRVVDPLYEALHAVGLDVGALELESQAIIRALISPELQLRKGLLVVDLGDQTRM